ncbi:MAG: glycosyltransferase [Myxococcota bacterium]
MILEAPRDGTPCLDKGPPFVLLLAPGGSPDPGALEHELAVLEQNPELCAVLDEGQERSERRTFLDLILYPERLASLLVRRNVLAACRHCLVLDGPLARATTALRLARGLPISWATAPLVQGAREPGRAGADSTAFAREALRSFAVEDLYPSLRTSPDSASLYSSLLDYASKLLAQAYRAEGFAIGAWAEALVEGRDSGLGLRLGLPKPSVGEEDRAGPSSRADPLVSIVIPTFQRLAVLPRALTSVADQTCQDLEVVVVNDGGACADATVEPFRAVIGGGGRVTLVRHETNRGLAAARNTGIRVARGRYVGLLDDDDRLLPHHVDALLLPLLLGARSAHADARGMIEVSGSPLPRSSALAGHYQAEYDPATYPIDNCFPVQTLLCERELILEAGGFDEGLPVLEDWDLWLRIFSIAPPAHVRRVTSEVRVPAAGTHMTQTRQSCWSETRAEIYGRTLDLERRDATLRRRRVEYLMGLESRSKIPFPRGAKRWLRGNGIFRIDPDDPMGRLSAASG